MTRSLAIVVFSVLLASVAQAQQPQPKDRKDFLLEALESQRNDGLAKLALCYADANEQIAKLNAKVAQLEAEAKKTLPAPVEHP